MTSSHPRFHSKFSLRKYARSSKCSYYYSFNGHEQTKNQTSLLSILSIILKKAIWGRTRGPYVHNLGPNRVLSTVITVFQLMKSNIKSKLRKYYKINNRHIFYISQYRKYLLNGGRNTYFKLIQLTKSHTKSKLFAEKAWNWY